jgi:HEAT repeat protein
LRQRIQLRIEKRLRSLLHGQPQITSELLKRKGSRELVPAFQIMILDPKAGWLLRATAAKLLAIADRRGTTAALLHLFSAQTEKIELWETALTIEHYGDQAAVPHLIGALYDANSHRRHAAARALGWIQPVRKRAAKALVQALLDKSQPQPVREEAAESLAYSGYEKAIDPLISVLAEPDVRIRFWAVFALGSIGQWRSEKDGPDPRIVQALERMLPEEVAPSNWWSVGKEALAMLGHFVPEYGAKLDSETRRVRNDPNASPEDLRWAT